MSHRRLDAASLTSLRAFRAVRAIVVASVVIYVVAYWFFGAPRAPGLAMLCLIIGWFVVLTFVSMRIRCPYCTKAAVASANPSWAKVPPFGRRGTIQCARCLEIIDASGGTPPPSNISLQADREL
jgi:hypothetical protein